MKLNFNNNTIKLAAFYLVTLLILFGNSCKKSQPAFTAVVPEKDVDIVKHLLPVKIKLGNQVTTLKYIAQKPLLTAIEQSDGYTTKIIYNSSGKPWTLEKYRDNELFQFADYFLNDKGLINRVNRFNNNSLTHTFDPNGHYTLNYNASDQLIAVSYYNKTGSPVKEEIRQYSADGNLFNITTTMNTGTSNTINYIYDNKNGMFKEIPFSSLFALEADDHFFMPGINNTLSHTSIETPTETISYSYQYDAYNYPKAISMTKGNITNAYTITYEEIKP